MNVQVLHDSEWSGVFYITGGGSLLLSDMLKVPGASQTVLDAQVPYSTEALTQLLGGSTESYCSKEAACALAMQAFNASISLRSSDKNFGFACTASLRSNEPKKGAHRAHIALQTSDTTAYWFIEFEKGELSREDEERKLGDFLMQSLGQGLSLYSDSSLVPDDSINVGTELASLINGRISHLNRRARVFLPGAFNPLHEGHKSMRSYVEEMLGEPVQYELSVQNVDKPPLDFIEMQRRMHQFSEDSLVLTNCPRFVEKAETLSDGGRGCTFVVGLDTFERIVSSRYYAGSLALRDEAIQKLTSVNTQFIVFGRLRNGNYRTLADVNIPDALRDFCRVVTEEEFRMDISSTQLRNFGKV